MSGCQWSKDVEGINETKKNLLDEYGRSNNPNCPTQTEATENLVQEQIEFNTY